MKYLYFKYQTSTHVLEVLPNSDTLVSELKLFHYFVKFSIILPYPILKKIWNSWMFQSNEINK